jgi:hypothetical protein
MTTCRPASTTESRGGYAYIQTISGSTAGQGELVLHGQDRLEGHWKETWAGWEPLPSDPPSAPASAYATTLHDVGCGAP